MLFQCRLPLARGTPWRVPGRSLGFQHRADAGRLASHHHRRPCHRGWSRSPSRRRVSATSSICHPERRAEQCRQRAHPGLHPTAAANQAMCEEHNVVSFFNRLGGARSSCADAGESRSASRPPVEIQTVGGSSRHKKYMPRGSFVPGSRTRPGLARAFQELEQQRVVYGSWYPSTKKIVSSIDSVTGRLRPTRRRDLLPTCFCS